MDLNDKTCSICLDNIEFNKDTACVIIMTQCNHFFHYNKCWKVLWEKCPEPALKISCPICRQRLNYEGELLTDKKYIKLLEAHITETEDNSSDEDDDDITDLEAVGRIASAIISSSSVATSLP